MPGRDGLGKNLRDLDGRDGSPSDSKLDIEAEKYTGNIVLFERIPISTRGDATNDVYSSILSTFFLQRSCRKKNTSGENPVSEKNEKHTWKHTTLQTLNQALNLPVL